eukprot:TRINITY_DN12890_c0_g1_i1.p1 TRINITY_DN12890_c0_g1~~TRINITY_DN12890_c0_g1_i1.p1  ORF type:complete len:223 (+),score=32.94 TRINITY_DN12890_c0_g1_i1:60-671(+)
MSQAVGLKLYRFLLKKASKVEANRLERYFCRSKATKRKFSKNLKELITDTLPSEGTVDLVSTVKLLARQETQCDKFNLGFEAYRYLSAVGAIDINLPKIFDKGDVVQHMLGETGVVIGRQPACIMPQNWIEDTYGPNHPLIKQPWYEVVLDKRDGGFVTHTPGAFLKLASNPIQSKLLQSEGWTFDDHHGKYHPPRDTWPPPL